MCSPINCNVHFCWRRVLASPAAEVKCYWDDLRSRFLVRELSYLCHLSFERKISEIKKSLNLKGKY